MWHFIMGLWNKKCYLEKGIYFCKSSNLKGAENKPLKSLKNYISQVQNTEKTDYFSGSRRNE